MTSPPTNREILKNYNSLDRNFVYTFIKLDEGAEVSKDITI